MHRKKKNHARLLQTLTVSSELKQVLSTIVESSQGSGAFLQHSAKESSTPEHLSLSIWL